MRAATLMAVFLVLARSAAAADVAESAPGTSYFQKDGATAAIHDADLLDCRALAGRMHQPSPPVPSTAGGGGGMAGAIGAAIAVAIIVAAEQAAADRKARPVNVENCMVVKGWRVVSLTPDDATAFAALDKGSKSARVGEWVGATQLHGAVARRFDNDVANSDSAQTFVVARRRGVSISDDVVAQGPTGPAEKHPVATIDPAVAQGRPRGAAPLQPLKDEQLGGVPAGTGMIIVNVRGDASAGLLFERLGPDPMTDAWVDGRPSQIFVNPPVKALAKAGARLGVTQVFSVPPGRWRLAAMSVGDISVNYCLGSPVFEVAAGEAVYAGSFSADHALPVMDLDLAKSAFPELSTVPDKIRPAVWTNGARGKCVGTYVYALEVPGQPFLDGYAWGSRAWPADPAPGAVAR